MPILELKNLTQRFGGLVAVSAVDYTVDEGRIDSLIGPNGAGKTTVFNAITGLVEPTTGEIEFEGEDVRLPFGPGVFATCLLIGLITGFVGVLMVLDLNLMWRAVIKRPLTYPDTKYSLAVAWDAAVAYYRGELAAERQQLGSWTVVSATGGAEFASVGEYAPAVQARDDLEELLATPDAAPPIERVGEMFELRSRDGQRVLMTYSTREAVDAKWKRLAEYAAARRWTTTYVALAFAFGLALGCAGSYAVWWQSRRTPDVIAGHGIARTFQNIRLFKDMTVLENVLVSLDQRRASSHWLWGWIANLGWADAAEIAEAQKLLDFVGLGDKGAPNNGGKAAMLAKSLPYGQQRRLEIARALALDPKLILLDEPAAGMNPAESLDLLWLIRAIRDRGVTVLLIEHHMRVVMDISDRIAVLHQGAKIAEGTPAEVRANPAVIEAYLGKEEVG